MTKGGRRTRAGAFACAALVLCLGTAPDALSQQQRKDLEALRQRIEKLRAALSDTEDDRNDAHRELREAELAVARSARELRAITGKLRAADADLQALDERRKAAQQRLVAREKQLGRLVAASYRAGEAGYLKLLLGGLDPNQAARDAHYLGYVSRAHAALIENVRAEIALAAELEAATRAKKAELDALAQREKEHHAALERQRQERRAALDRLTARLRAQRQQVKALESDEARLAKLVAELGRVIATVPPHTPRAGADAARPGSFSALKGRLPLPAPGTVANRFGAPRIEGGPSWKGIFIRVPQGADVRAVAAGRVVFSEWMRGLGNLVILDHGSGYLTIYGNNEAVYKSVGDEVAAGEVLASAGASSDTGESGIYFEIRHEGRAFDPMSWVAGR